MTTKFTKKPIAILGTLIAVIMQTHSALAQDAGAIANIYLPQDGGYDEVNNTFTNTIELLTDDTTLTVDAFGTNDFTQTVETTAVLDHSSGDYNGISNMLDAYISGAGNALYFTQTGNSLLALVVDGVANTITLADLGGSDSRREDLSISITGDDNEVDTTNRLVNALAQALAIAITGDSVIAQLNYDDFGKIVGTIGKVAASRNVTLVVNQDNNLETASTADGQFNAVVFDINTENAGALASLFTINQVGVGNVLNLTATGSEHDITLSQTNIGGSISALNDLNLTVGSATKLALTLDGTVDADINLNGGNNQIVIDNSVRTTDEESIIVITESGDSNSIKVGDFSLLTIGITGSGNRIGGATDDASTTASNGNFDATIEGDYNQLDISNNRYEGFDLIDFDSPPGLLINIQGSSNLATIKEEGQLGGFNTYAITGDSNEVFADIAGQTTAGEYYTTTILGSTNTAIISIAPANPGSLLADTFLLLSGTSNYLGVYASGTVSYEDALTSTPDPFLYSAPEYSAFLDQNYLAVNIFGNDNSASIVNKAGVSYSGLFDIAITGDNNNFLYSLADEGDFRHNISHNTDTIYGAQGWSGTIESNGYGGFNQSITAIGVGFSSLKSPAGQVLVTNEPL